MQCGVFVAVSSAASVLFLYSFLFVFGLVFVLNFPRLHFSFNDYILWFVINSETGDSHNNKIKKKYGKNFSFPISLFAIALLTIRACLLVGCFFSSYFLLLNLYVFFSAIFSYNVCMCVCVFFLF